MRQRPAVLLVCLGNICRSPLAEAALRQAAHSAGMVVEIDSSGTGAWHVGEPPDPRAQAVARANGLDISDLRGRQIGPEGFHRYDLVVALDRENLRILEALRPPGARAQLSLLLDHVPGRAGKAVADPYHGGASGFRTTWADVTSVAAGLIETLRGCR